MSAGKIALIQMVSTPDVSHNLERAGLLLEQAAADGAQLAVLPENFAVLQNRALTDIGHRESSPEGGPIKAFLSECSRRLELWVVAGSIPLGHRPNGEPIDDGRVRASCLVYSAAGDEVARYDKIHLFDAAVGDRQGQYRESDTFEPGDELVTVDTPVGRLGLTICYDLRFPELYRALRARGAEGFVVPAAFTWRTGQAHWEPLLRARAIENQCWVAAPNQGGWHSSKRRTWGHSMLVDSWGEILVEAEEGEACVCGQRDADAQATIRRNMPAWEHRRLPTSD